MYDFHIHSHFSPDSKMSMEAIINKAIELGLQEISFTDHIDYEYSYNNIKFEFDPKLYFKELKRLINIYGNEINIRSGVEIGLQPHLLNKYKDLVSNFNFDFILASIHSVEKISLTKKDLATKHGVDYLWQKYFSEMLYSIKNFKQFQVLGHLDAPKRYNIEVANSSIQQYYPIIKDIYHYLICNGKGIEVNSAGNSYYGLKDNNPSQDLLKLYRECGGEIITFGSDAHSINRVGDNYQTTIKMLRDLGFKYICTFQNQQPFFHRI